MATAGRTQTMVQLTDDVIARLDECGMPTRCAISLNNLGDAWQAVLTEHLHPERVEDAGGVRC